MTQITVIVPVYNEAEHILPFFYELKKYLPTDFELIWVNDGSTDSTLSEIEQLALRDDRIRCITLTRNFGQVNAVSAGLDFAEENTIVIMSGDLKHPPALIPLMLNKLSEGFEIVTALPNNTAKTFLLQRKLLDLYYQILNKIAPNRNNADLTQFRAFNSTVTEGINQIKENNLVLNNFFNWSGYRSTSINYYCAKCTNKIKKYSLSHLVTQTKKAISIRKFEFYKSFFFIGGVITTTSTIMLFLYLNKIINGVKVNNLALILLSMLFAGGIQLLIQSKYRKMRIIESEKAIRKPNYIIKDIIEQQSSYYKYSFEQRN